MEENYLEKLSKTLQKDLLAEKTVRNYTHSIKKFIEYFNDREIKTINQDDVASYIRFLEERRHLKPQSINLYLNAIAYFLNKVVESPIDTDLIPRKKRSLYDIPDILSPDEIKLIFDRLSFLKHKIMIMLAYGCGMTPSQICNVKVFDLNFEHKRIKVPPYNVHKKSIVMLLPDKIIPLLLQYIEKDKPGKYLFESRVTGKRYDTGRIINYAFAEALEKSGIHKKISLKDFFKRFKK